MDHEPESTTKMTVTGGSPLVWIEERDRGDSVFLSRSMRLEEFEGSVDHMKIHGSLPRSEGFLRLLKSAHKVTAVLMDAKAVTELMGVIDERHVFFRACEIPPDLPPRRFWAVGFQSCIGLQRAEWITSEAVILDLPQAERLPASLIRSGISLYIHGEWSPTGGFDLTQLAEIPRLFRISMHGLKLKGSEAATLIGLGAETIGMRSGGVTFHGDEAFIANERLTDLDLSTFGFGEAQHRAIIDLSPNLSSLDIIAPRVTRGLLTSIAARPSLRSIELKGTIAVTQSPFTIPHVENVELPGAPPEAARRLRAIFPNATVERSDDHYPTSTTGRTTRDLGPEASARTGPTATTGFGRETTERISGHDRQSGGDGMTSRFFDLSWKQWGALVLVAAISQAGCRPGGGDSAGRARAPAAKAPAAIKGGARPPMTHERVWTLARPFLGDPLKDGFRARIEVIDGDRLRLTTESPTRRVIYLREVEGGVSVADDAGFRSPRLHPPETMTASSFDKGVLKAMGASESRSEVVGKIVVEGGKYRISIYGQLYPSMAGGFGMFSFKKSGELLDYMAGA